MKTVLSLRNKIFWIDHKDKSIRVKESLGERMIKRNDTGYLKKYFRLPKGARDELFYFY